ncbi:MAG TPA: hypothetical protein DCY12_10575 [Candidatus Atribacteria bacterium]|nr:hypothetical protein [Candidatus Atribacteria bacterium]
MRLIFIIILSLDKGRMRRIQSVSKLSTKNHTFFVIARPRFLRSWQSLDEFLKQIDNGKAGIYLFHE